MTKKVKVQLTYEWEFSEKEWSDEEKHLEELRSHPQIVLGYDVLSSFHALTDITYPEVTKVKVKDA